MSSSPELVVDWCSYQAAKYAVEHWHYSGTMPAGKLVKVGVWEGGKFIGAVLFGRGANNHLGSRYGLEQTEACELVRVALAGHKAPVTQIVAHAIGMLRVKSGGLRLIVSYADPEQGHNGAIYQAGNWLYAGKSNAQLALRVDGAFMHKRAASSRWGTASPDKIRQLEPGVDVKYGPEEWKHTYLYPLDRAMRRQIEPLAKPYPKCGPGVQGDTSDCQSEGPGSSPGVRS